MYPILQLNPYSYPPITTLREYSNSFFCIRNMHAIGSGIMGDSEYLHGIAVLNTTSQFIYNASRPKLDRGI